MRKPSRMSRRDLLRGAAIGACAFAMPAIAPFPIFGQEAPSNRIVFGFVGTGGMGQADIDHALATEGVRVAAVCDVDAAHLETARAKVDKANGGSGCATFSDFRDLARRPGIDAVVIATPDHWHVLAALEAVRAGKDVYVEKPLSLTIREGRELVRAVRAGGRVAQTGSHQRSDAGFRKACELVRNGRIGTVKNIIVVIPANNRSCPASWSPEAVPPGFDYDFWLGPAPWEPYTSARCHYQFRFIRDYSGGQVTNWGAHYLDIAQWALGMDDSGPILVQGDGVFPDRGLFDTATHVDFTCVYANGTLLRCYTRYDGVFDGAIRFEGDGGWIEVARDRLIASKDEILSEPLPEGAVRLQVSTDHMRDFVDAIRTRRRPVADVEIGHRSASVCHLGNIAMQLRSALHWNPAREEFVGDEMANRLRSRAMRGPWAIV